MSKSTKTRKPVHTGARVEFDGRTGTLTSFCRRSKYSADFNGHNEDRSWVVLFDGDDRVSLVAPEDTDRVVDVTPALRVSPVQGGSGYELDLPNGTYKIFKRGAYWYWVAPGKPLPAKGDFSGITTRDGAVSGALNHFLWVLQQATKAVTA